MGVNEARVMGRLLKRVNRRPPRSGGGLGPLWILPKSDEPKVPALLYPGKYVLPVAGHDGSPGRVEYPFFVYFRHWHNSDRRYYTCEAGIAETKDGLLVTGSEPCELCDQAAQGRHTGVSFAYLCELFNAVLLQDFHKVEETSKRGHTYQKDVACTGKRCPHCAQNNPKEFGRAVYLPLGGPMADQLSAFALNTLARTCTCGDHLQPVAFTCHNCQSIIRDLEENPASVRELAELNGEPHRCPHCQETDYLEEQARCENPECTNPTPLGLWTTIMELYTTDETTSDQSTRKVLSVGRYKLLRRDIHARIKEKMSPLDFAQLTAGNTYSLRNSPEDSGGSKTAEKDIPAVAGSDVWGD